MRQFGKDAPEFFCFKLEGDETVYKIPLAGSMSNLQIAELEEVDNSPKKQMEWMRHFIGDKVEELSLSTTGDIFKEWAKASREVQGTTPGES